MNLKEYTKSKKRVYSGKIIKVFSDKVILPNKRFSIREYVLHPGAVAVIPFLDRDKIILVKQYRYPIARITYELPAGKLDRGEGLIECVKRELEEETGYRAYNIKRIYTFWPTPAFSDEIIHIFSAHSLVKVKKNTDDDEFLEVKIISFKQVLDWVLKGKIRDSKTIIGVLIYAYTNNIE